jgi:hypothetical protein
MSHRAQKFIIDCFDTELASRTTAGEWERILVLRNNPNLISGLFQYDALIPEYFANNIILNKIVTELWRFEMLVYTLYLHDIADPNDPRSGLTVSNLQKLCAKQKCASYGRVLAILGIMGIGGFLKKIKTADDKRVTKLEPTEKFIQIVEGWNHRILKIIDTICSDDDLSRSFEAMPRLGWEMRRIGAETIIGGWKLIDPFPEVDHFVTRDAGWMLLLTSVAKALRSSQGQSIDPVSIDLKLFGARFGVSRSHLRRLLESAYEQKYLIEPPLNGTNIVLSSQLVAAFLTCMASELGNYRLWTLQGRSKLLSA